MAANQSLMAATRSLMGPKPQPIYRNKVPLTLHSIGLLALAPFTALGGARRHTQDGPHAMARCGHRGTTPLPTSTWRGLGDLLSTGLVLYWLDPDPDHTPPGPPPPLPLADLIGGVGLCGGVHNIVYTM